METPFQTLYLANPERCTLGWLCFLSENKDAFGAAASLIGTAAFFLGLLTFGFGLLQYRTAQRWKRAEFIASEMKEFRENPWVQDVLNMMDYHGRQFHDGEDEDRISIIVNHSGHEEIIHASKSFEVDLGRALHFHEDGSVSRAEQAIRDRFDAYLMYFERFEIYIKNKLFLESEIEPYLRYHIDLVNGQKSHSGGYHRALFAYMVLYELNWALLFFRRFPQSAEVKSAIAEATGRKELRRTAQEFAREG